MADPNTAGGGTEGLRDDDMPSPEETAAMWEEGANFRNPTPPPIPVRDSYYITECEHCAWVGSSEQCGGGDDDIVCPVCCSSIIGDEPSEADTAKHGEAVMQRILTAEAALARASAEQARAEAERDEARSYAEKAESEAEELRGTPWPEWTERCLKVIRAHSGYDGYDDAADGVDLPGELEETLNEYEAEAKRQRHEARAKHETDRHKAAVEHYQDQVRKLCGRVDAAESRVASLAAERDRLEAVRDEREAWAAAWHRVVETTLILLDLSPALGGDEATSAIQAALAKLTAERDRLKAAIQAFLDGNYDHPRRYRPGKCPHGIYYFDECPSCDEAHFTAALKLPEAPDAP